MCAYIKKSRGECEVDGEAKLYSAQMLSHCFRQKPCFGAAVEVKRRRFRADGKLCVGHCSIECHLSDQSSF